MPLLPRFWPLLSLALLASAQEADFLKETSGARSTQRGAAPGNRHDIQYRVEKKDQTQAEESLAPAEVRYRGIFRMREVRTESDWDCDPTAIPAWCRQFKMRLGLNAQWMNPRQPVTLDDDEIFQAPLLYMTGHNAFSFSEPEVKNLRRYLLNGGALWVDDCLYGFPFGRSFRSEIKRVFPEYGLEPVLPTEKGVNALFGMHYQIQANSAGLPTAPHLSKIGVPVEVLRIDGRVAVLLSPYDLGCHAEISSPPTPANPLGGPMHGIFQSWREESYRLSTNIVLFLLTH